ncbi:hypothetical protein PTSG_00724 [Salpingoeca rosetta]|uniref:Uncharacterized protein n=1 Tax=Salpingoeca rosetta (strain ATCC 50818 / BSB-021) TaxID=946362 RepID=F2TXA7_SALR5|nr:uncharacterized protein PTSG_00724 [Salpingoeca rosetta]EGD76016.1 hypothetical protein PTSG_00724 [Salpingoeca rosetta]|eukprot:XP_004998191.1 hypothetical protein PTSG_00724 [Salpingoeca rosetta]
MLAKRKKQQRVRRTASSLSSGTTAGATATGAGSTGAGGLAGHGAALPFRARAGPIMRELLADFFSISNLLMGCITASMVAALAILVIGFFGLGTTDLESIHPVPSELARNQGFTLTNVSYHATTESCGDYGTDVDVGFKHFRGMQCVETKYKAKRLPSFPDTLDSAILVTKTFRSEAHARAYYWYFWDKQVQTLVPHMVLLNVTTTSPSIGDETCVLMWDPSLLPAENKAAHPPTDQALRKHVVFVFLTRRTFVKLWVKSHPGKAASNLATDDLVAMARVVHAHVQSTDPAALLRAFQAFYNHMATAAAARVRRYVPPRILSACTAVASRASAAWATVSAPFSSSTGRNTRATSKARSKATAAPPSQQGTSSSSSSSSSSGRASSSSSSSSSTVDAPTPAQAVPTTRGSQLQDVGTFSATAGDGGDDDDDHGLLMGTPIPSPSPRQRRRHAKAPSLPAGSGGSDDGGGGGGDDGGGDEDEVSFVWEFLSGISWRDFIPISQEESDSHTLSAAEVLRKLLGMLVTIVVLPLLAALPWPPRSPHVQ